MRALPWGSLAGSILLTAAVATQQPPASTQPTPAQTRPSQPGPSASPRDLPAAETGTARIRGRVTSGQTGKPVRRARVRIFVNQTQFSRFSNTDADGRYEFAALPAGRYSVHVTKAGYVSLAPRSGGSDGGKLFDLADGQLADRVDFVLSRGGAIVGRITDETGEPVTGAEVQALRLHFRPSGQRQLAPRETGNQVSFRTNDLGEFRVFGLMPGSYVVAATVANVETLDMRWPTTTGASGTSKTDGPVRTYYPGTPTPAEAEAITIDLKHEPSASFALVPARLSRVSGTVRNSEGRPAAGVWVSVRAHDEIFVSSLIADGGGQVSADGSFELANVAPGTYSLEADAVSSRFVTSATGEFASVPIVVAGDPVSVDLTMSRGVAVTGRVTFEGKPPQATPGTLAIAAMPEDVARNFVTGSGPRGPIDARGNFAIPSVHGRVLFRPINFPQPWLLKAVKLNGVEITDMPLDVANANLTELEVILTDRPAYLTGYVRNAKGEALTNFKVLVFPDGLKDDAVPIRYMHTSSPDATGRYQIGRMPPGDYIAVAVEGIGVGDEWDPDLRKRVAPLAKRFSLVEGQTLSLDLPLVQR